MTNYTDADITFFVGLYHDLDRAEGALCRLREHFPDARVIVRSDGDRNPKNRKLSERYGVEYWEEERLYPIENGGAMIARILELYLDNSTRFLLKIDTDTGIHRRFKFLPERNGVFGTRQISKLGCVSIQGGCMGFSENVSRSILDSGLLKDPRLKNPIIYGRQSKYFSQMGKRAQKLGLCGFEWIIAWAANELQIPLISFTEVRCRWHLNSNIANENLKFAITHPVSF